VSTHLLDEDLLLVVSGELAGPDLIHASEHIRSCVECRERAAHWLTTPGSAVAGTFHEELEQTIALVESGRAPIGETLSRLQAMELALYVAGRALGRDSANLDRQRARALFYQAWLLKLHGSLGPSREAAIRARGISTALGDEVQATRALAVEAATLGYLRQTKAAVTAAREAAEIFNRHGEHRRARIARGIEATALEVVDEHGEAARIYRELITVTGAGDPDRLHWLNDLSACLMELGELDRAEEIASEVLRSPAVEPETVLSARWVCAGVLARRGDFDEALKRLRVLREDARALERRTYEMLANYTMAHIFSTLNRSREAAVMAREVIAYFTEEKIPFAARGAIALLREAVVLDSAWLFDELETVRRAFPELFPRVLPLPSTPSRRV
jgi:tetratricopeptide (TPR) repeat protein